MINSNEQASYIEQPRFSCALAAQQTVLAIPRALPIVHSGPGCVGKTFAFASYGAGFQGEGYGGGGTVSCTNTNEQDVVFGGEEKLSRFIEGAFKVLKGDLFVVLSGCTSGIVGDDVAQVASVFARQGRPIVGVETSGFRGNNYLGHELVVSGIIRGFIGDPQVKVKRGLVNVFSVVPCQNPFWRSDLEEIKRILQAVGLEVNILFGNESQGVEEWKTIPHAQFNLVLSSWVGLQTAELLKDTYGTPYLHIPYLPSGAEETSRVLREIGVFAGLDPAKVETVIRKEEKRFYSYFVSLADFLADFRNNIPFELYTIADSSYAAGLSGFLVNELGFVPRGVYITDDPPVRRRGTIEKVFSDMAADFDGTLSFQIDGGPIQEDIRKKLGGSSKAVIMGSTWEDKLAAENGNLSLHVSLPINNSVIINRSYAGYNGGLRLMEDIYEGIFRKGNIASTTQTR
ncbi:MAG: hydrogenase [Spirochaetaceae bacterium]|jgi:nitrogenase molybdenum-iron protein beta chain|nr:hydrogenase [Spirochaetaceae bacterium]